MQLYSVCIVLPKHECFERKKKNDTWLIIYQAKKNPKTKKNKTQKQLNSDLNFQTM